MLYFPVLHVLWRARLLQVLFRLCQLGPADVDADDAIKVRGEDQGALAGAAPHVHGQVVQVVTAALGRQRCTTWSTLSTRSTPTHPPSGRGSPRRP